MPDITIQPPLLWGYHKKGHLLGYNKSPANLITGFM